MSLDARIASLIAFSQARAMGTGTNAGGGVLTGAADCGRDSDGKFGSGNTCRIGININDKHQDFTGLILAGKKTSETRITQSLKPYVGKTVGIVRTGKGPATLVGMMKIGEPKFYKTAGEFDADFDKHQVGKDSPHYIGPEGKYGYPLSEVKPVKPVVLKTKGIVGRVIHKSYRELHVEYDLSGESPEHPQKSDRAFCPTGEGGGVDNSCGGASKPSWMGKVDASGSSKHGTWFLEKNEKGHPSPGHGEVTSHVIRLVGSDGKVKAFSYADLSSDGKDLYMNYSEVAKPLRGQGVYKSLLDSLSDQFRVTSDEQHNVATAAKKAYESLGGSVNHYGQYVIGKKRRDSRAFCPTGPGGGIDNSCGKSSGEPPRERLSSARTRGGRQTDIARKINQMGSSEKQIEQLVRDLGGDLKKTLIDMETTRGNEGLNIFIRDKELDENYYIHFGYYGATIYPTEKLSDEKTKEVVAAAEKAFPKTISDRLWLRGKPFPIAISYNYKNGKPGFTSGKATARYASLLAFAEARDCGRDPDGKFSTGNTCAGGAVAEAAKGAVTGGIKGAITGLLTGGPVIVKPAAAIGAATGAVKGLYDNQMRPTRVKRAIERIGMTEKGVGSLVEKLGGTPESSADVRGNSLRLTIRDKEGNKTFHVEVNNKTITVYPRRASGELNSKEIERLKTIADEATPKSVGVVVKQSSSAYIAKLVKSGFSIAAGHARDILLATYSTPIVHSVAVDTLQSLKKRRF